MNGASENILWTSFKNGDDSALARIFTKYADQLYAYGLKIVNDEALIKLNGHQRELIHLKYTLDFSNTEIAELLQIDVASVRTLLYRSLKKVRKLLTL